EMLEVVATIQDVSCFGGSDGYIWLTISKGVGPYPVEWTYPDGNIVLNQNITNLKAGLYKAVVTDARGHRFEREYNISQPDLLEVENLISSRLDIPCFGEKTGRLDIRVTGGTTPYSIQWTGPDVPTVVPDSLSVQSLGAGTYTVHIKDDNGCRVQSTQTINQPTRLQVQAVVTNNTCYDQANGSIDLIVSGGVPSYTFDWTGIGVVPRVEDQANLATGDDYAVRVWDSNDCFVDRKFSISSPTELLIDVEQVNVSCYGKRDGRLHARVSGGSYPYQHRWTYENGTVVQDSIILALYPGKYTYTLTDASGCTVVSDEYEITQPGPLQVSISGSSMLCQGVDDGELIATASGGTGTGYSFTWTRLSPNTPFGVGPQLTNLGPGWYRVQVTDKNQCTATDEKEIKYSPIMSIQLVEKQNVLVTGENTGIIELDVQGGTPALTYSWSGGNLPTPSPNSLRVENLIAGRYYFTVEDGLGCSIDTTITITQPEIIDVTAVTKNIACHGESNGYIWPIQGYRKKMCNMHVLVGRTNN
ncbi:MAG TPA: SprB repeat-containing protein, partial [Paludibacteraceae bacterium]|nr:SprB repeat-containing protein [Paludibacteraceae bacterium]